MVNSLIPWRRNETQRGNNGALMAPFTQMRSDWDRMFDRFLDDFWGQSPLAQPQGMPLDLTETDDEIRVRVEIPGIDPEDLEVSLSGEILTLSAEKAGDTESHEVARSYNERHFGLVRRAVRLPCPVDPDRVRAEHKHGVVSITLQKAEAVRPKRIKIKSA